MARLKKSELLELRKGVNELHVAKEHGAAAVALHAQFIKDFFPILALRNPLPELFVELSDGFSAAPASYGNNHCITCMISGSWTVLFRADWAS